ncbi:ABC transporter permease [Anaerosporobacter sp.]|uniref:ABC transporter permease n=1 Tax=Anaerosporobacter sp. TaxID=1872529 RepID=UPI00286F6126|nr:ABC transporter permease [Anaerosporobacter sp.]
MHLYSIVKVEFKKLLKKPLSFIVLAVLFIPIFYTYSVLTDAPLLQMTPSGAMDFAFGQWSLLGMTGLFQVLFSLVVVNSFSSEIDKGQIKMAVLRQCSRTKLVYAKVIVLFLYMMLCYVVYLVFALCCYYGFVVHTSYGTGEWISEAIQAYGVGRFIMSGLFTLMDTLVTVGILFLCSLRFKTGICFMLAVGTSTLLLIMQFFPIVQYLVPAYVGNLLDYGMISPLIAGGLCLLYLLVTMVCVGITARKFERMDLR